MNKARKFTNSIFLVVMCLLFAGISIQGNNFFIYRLLESKSDQVERVERANPYNEAMAEELELLQKQYTTADDVHKKAIADIMLHGATVMNEGKLPTEIVGFIRQLERERNLSLK